MDSLLEAQAVAKGYPTHQGRLDVLRDLDLRVEPGESVAVIGASGAGKSTLLHILGGLDSPDRGRVRFRGVDLYADGKASVRLIGRYRSARWRGALRSRHIGFVFQAYHLLPELTVLENVALPAMMGRGWSTPSADARRRAMDWLERVGLADRSAHLPLELSGGEQQRLALARALMNDPDLILADEPTGNLDNTTGDRVLDHVFRVVREGGKTLVVVTHSERVARLCGRALRLADGRLQPA